MASGGHQNTPSNFTSRDDLVDPRWAFPNNLDSGKRRPKKQGNKGLVHRTEGYGVPQPPGDKLNISLSEGDGLPKPIHSMLSNDKEDNLKRVVTAQELELMLSILDREQKDLRNKDDHHTSDSTHPKLIQPKEKLHHRQPLHSASPIEAKANHKRFPEQPPDQAPEEVPYQLMFDQLYKDVLMFKRLTGQHNQMEAAETTSHHRSLPPDDHLQEKKNNVDLRFMDSQALHNNYNSDQGEQDYGAKNSLQPTNDSKQKMLDAIKGRINHLHRILHDNHVAMQKMNHLEGKCMRHNNLNQFPARRHYEAEGRANEEPDLAANLVAGGDSDEELWEPQLHDKIKRLEKAKEEIQQLQALASNNQQHPRQQNLSSVEEGQLRQRDLDYMQKQLGKIFRKLSNYQQVEAKDNNLVYKQQQQNNSSRSASSLNSEEGNSSTLPATATWGGFSTQDNMDSPEEEEDDDSVLANFSHYLPPQQHPPRNNCKPEYREVPPTIPKNQSQRNFTPPQPEQQPQSQQLPPGPHSDSSEGSSSWHWFTHQVQSQLDQMASMYQALVMERSPAPAGLLLLGLSQCYHMLYLQQLEIQNLQAHWSPPPTLNNQAPPRARPANNFWDNFRSYSCQNLLSSPSSSVKTGPPPPTRLLNEHLSSSQPSVSSQNECTIPKVPDRLPSKNKKPNFSLNSAGKTKSPPYSDEGPSNLPTPTSSSKDSSWAELGHRTGLNPGYLLEVVRQLQALPSEQVRLQALHSLQDLAAQGPPSSTGAVRKDPRRIKQELPPVQSPPAENRVEPPDHHPLQGELQAILARCSGRELSSVEAELYRQLTHAFLREAPPPAPPSSTLAPSSQQPRSEEDLEAEGDDLAEADQNDSLLLGAVGGADEEAADSSVAAVDGQEPQGADVRVEDAPPQEAPGENTTSPPGQANATSTTTSELSRE